MTHSNTKHDLKSCPNQEHWFDFTREPACYLKNGIMSAWCFVHMRWENWRLYADEP